MTQYEDPEDELTKRAAVRWFNTARNEVYFIWDERDAVEPRIEPPRGFRGCEPLPRNWRSDTTRLVNWITARLRPLDPKPIQTLYEAIRHWRTDRNASRVPPNSVLESLLDDAFVVLSAVEADIDTRRIAEEERLGHLYIVLGDRKATRVVNGVKQTAEFGSRLKPWKMFKLLVEAGRDGMHKDDLRKHLDMETKDEAGLRQHKGTVNTIVMETLRVEVIADGKGVWRIISLD